MQNSDSTPTTANSTEKRPSVTDSDFFFFASGSNSPLPYSLKEKATITAEKLIEKGWERLHYGNWKDVSEAWRKFYGWGALIKALLLLQSTEYSLAIKTLDLGVLMGGMCLDHYSAFVALLEFAQKQLKISINVKSRKRKRECIAKAPCTNQGSIVQSFQEKLTNPIERIEKPSLETFLVNYMLPNKPVILTNVIDNWPALGEHSWEDIEYLKEVAGPRTVPIEVGNTYLKDNWSQTLMPFSEFIDSYVLPSNDSDEEREIGYLAQTQLFDQIPQLGKDFYVPEYCTLANSDSEPKIQAWFGPMGTVSPLHYDAYHNLFAQVVGCKYVRLYSPEQTPCIYPHDSKMLHNTSQVDVENVDTTAFPNFESAPYQDCVLQKGEILYIPPKWWHFVRSLMVSFSVSFWF